MNRDEMVERLDEIRSRIAELAELEDITEEQDAELERSLDEEADLTADLTRLDERQARVDAVRARPDVVRTPAVPEVMRQVEVDVDVRRAGPGELRDAALKMLEGETRGVARDLAAAQVDHVERLIRTQNGNVDGSQIARRMLVTESPAYRSAFVKGVTQAQPAWTADEARAIDEYRAMSAGTDTAGGFGVPVLIDPSIILTSGAAAAPVLDISRVVTITTDEWKGVSSAGVSWSYDAEASAVSDDAPTLAQPVVPVRTARGFIPYSIEVGQDYPGFAAEMRRLLDAGYVDLIAVNSITGDGSAPNPRGIVHRLDATTTSEVSVTTAGSFGGVDVLKVWKELPERYRSRATWLMSTGVENAIRTLSQNQNLGFYTIDLTSGGLGNLFGRPVRTTDYMPDLPSGTAAANVLVVGDFENFVVAQRAGMTVEFIPHLFDTTTARPTGQRGWFAYARHGYDTSNPAGFRLLTNT